MARTLASESNLLLLDELTNHLDMDSSDALMAVVDEFEGAEIHLDEYERKLAACGSTPADSGGRKSQRCDIP